MNKRRKIDFVLEEDDFEKVVFRFYPRQSSCHSFGDEPPKSHEDVYKVYFYYKVIKYYKDDDGNIETYYILFDSECDECSLIGEVAARLKYLSEDKKEVTVNYHNTTYTVQLLDNEIFTAAYCVRWNIKEHSDCYKFELFRTHDDVGYRFWLDKEKAYEFGAYLNYCCEYMLEHGDPI